MVGWPASVPRLQFLETGDAALDGLLDWFVVTSRLRSKGAGCKQPNHGCEDVMLHLSVPPWLSKSEICSPRLANTAADMSLWLRT